MSAVEILDSVPGRNPILRGFAIDKPKPGDRFDTHAIQFEGWVLGAEECVESVEIVCDGILVGGALVNRERPDVAASFPGRNADFCGFRVAISVLGLPPKADLMVRAVFKEGGRIPISVLKIARERLSLGPAEIAPLMVTTPGRTGSTWLTHLLGQHPRIVSYQPFRYEARVANYWMSVLKTLCEPHSYLHSMATSLSDDYWWLGDRAPEAALPLADPIIERWLGEGALQTLARDCRRLTGEFYRKAAGLAGKETPTYFVEKFSPGQRLQPFVGEIYPNAKEVFLVRDFRDMLCSILAYNKKRRMEGFGRHLAGSDEEYVRQLRGWAVGLHRNWTSRSKHACLVLYEDLVSKPADTLRKIFEYLDLPSEPDLVEQVIERAVAEKSAAQKAHQTSARPADSIGRWRRELDAGMKAACEEAFDEILQEFGYEPVGSIA